MKRKEHLFVLVLVVLFTTAGTAVAQPFPTPPSPTPPSATNFVVVLSGDAQVSPVDTVIVFRKESTDKKMAKELLTIEEVANYLQINRYTIYRLLAKKKLPAFKVGGQWRFYRNMIDAWLLKNSNSWKPSARRDPSSSSMLLRGTGSS